MLIGQRIRELREAKKLSQGEIEERTGLLRVYTSRVENGHIVPTLETLEKYALALEVPLYRLFYDGDGPPQMPKLASKEASLPVWGTTRSERQWVCNFVSALSRMNDKQRQLLLAMAQRMAGHVRAK